MVKTKKKTYITRNQAQKFGGGPSELQKTEPCTYREVVKHFYFLENQEINSSFHEIASIVASDVMSVWAKVNPNLPLSKPKTINKRIREVLITAQDINKKKGSGKKRKELGQIIR